MISTRLQSRTADLGSREQFNAAAAVSFCVSTQVLLASSCSPPRPFSLCFSPPIVHLNEGYIYTRYSSLLQGVSTSLCRDACPRA